MAIPQHFKIKWKLFTKKVEVTAQNTGRSKESFLIDGTLLQINVNAFFNIHSVGDSSKKDGFETQYVIYTIILIFVYCVRLRKAKMVFLIQNKDLVR